MSLTNWYILGIFFIIFQNIPDTLSAIRERSECRGRQTFASNMIVNTRKKTMNNFVVTCSTATVFEVRFTNGQLCNCGKFQRVGTTLTKDCKKRLPLDAVVNISVTNVRSRSGENCTFQFFFRKGEIPLTLFMVILPTQVVRSSYVVSHAVTRSSFHQQFITSYYVTSTVLYKSIMSPFGHRPTTSSPVINQSKLTHSASRSTRIKSTMVNLQSSQSSHAVSHHTGIVTTSTAILQSTISSVYQNPDLTTSNLPSEPVLKTSSHVSPPLTGILITPTLMLQSTVSSVYHSPDLNTSSLPTELVLKTSSHAIPHFTGIVVTPTPILQFTSSFHYHSPDVATSSLPKEPVLVTSSMDESPLLKTSTFIKASPTTSKATSSSTLSAGEKEMKKLREDIDFIKKLNTSSVGINDSETISRVLDAAVNLINSNITTLDQEEDPGMQAVEVLQNLGQTISRQLDLGNESSVTFQRVTEDLVFGAAVINVSSSPGFEFPSKKDKIKGDEKIDIPKSVFLSESGKAYFVGMIFKAYREMRNNTGNEGFKMGTKVINAIVSPAPSTALKEPVEMMFEKTFVGQTFAWNCSFYIENSSLSGEYGRWSTKQCFNTFENESHVKCKCNHFTNFAVLFKVTDDQAVSEEDSFRLVIITYIGLSLSILGCLLTFIIYISLSNIKSDRATIHTNLVLALGIADVIFLVTVAVKPDGDSCLALAMLAFYFYLAVFFWMLVEGVYIYLMVVKVFRGNVARRRRLAYLVGWGCPIIIAVVTWAVLTDDVVSKYHCWLSVESGAIWAFVGPGLFIILVNLIILMSVMRTTWAHFVDDKEYGGLKSATKTFGAVIPILGITWVFGVMAFNESSVVFQYIFAITNSIQGLLIFILYCIINNEVRTELHRRFTVWQTRREMTSSSAGGRRPTYPYVISSEKNTTFNRTMQSGQATPDLLRYPLNEMKAEKPELAEQRYPFEDSSATPKPESHVDEKSCTPDHEVDRDSGRSTPVDVEKGSEVNNVAGNDSVG